MHNSLESVLSLPFAIPILYLGIGGTVIGGLIYMIIDWGKRRKK